MSEKPKNALSNVVSDLIRAAAGSSARNVSDANVDKYVADLILKEAQEKRKKYDVVGVKAYQPNGLPDKPKPKPNTRFLLNMVKATDSHNQAVIKANEDNVAKLREERLERERCSRLKEIEEKHHRERRRHRLSNDRHYTKDKHTTDDHKRRKRSSDDDEAEKEKEHKKHKRKSSSSSSSSSRRHHHHHEKSSKRSSDSKPTKPEQVQYKGRGKVRINVSSMDKYFAKGYDPLLDMDSDKEEEYVFAKEDTVESKKRKHKKKSKKKSHKHRESSSSSSSSEEEEQEQPQKPVRAWDVGKV
ncbi:unnamed protein product [Mucor hiemalis]